MKNYKIVVLDQITIGKDLDYSALNNLGEVIFYDYTLPAQTAERIKDADIVVTNKVVIDTQEFRVAEKLKFICVAATGYNNINVSEAKKLGIYVANVKGYSTNSVAQQVFAYILAFYNSIFEYQAEIKNNKWQQSNVFNLLKYPIYELYGKNLGIIGYGAIGQKVAEIGKAFGMNILPAKLPNRKYTDTQRVDFQEVIRQADVLTIHTPLTIETQNLIQAQELAMMKKSAILVNAARGGIVNEKDLYNALVNRTIRGAIVDVLTEEPPSNGNILFSAPNIFITPHSAWTSIEARKTLIAGIVNNIEFFIAGKAEKISLI
jgi:glycerate dehydrogenase